MSIVRNRRTAIIALITLLVILCRVFAAGADDVNVSFSKPGPSSYEFSGKTPDGWGWTSAPWNGDDRPYAKIRSDIDTALAAGENCEDLYRVYRKKAISNPDDPAAQFGRAYLSWKIAHLVDDAQESSGVLEEALDGLDSIRFPLTYNTVRIRFLIQTHLAVGSQLLGVAHELYLHDQSDEDVMGSYCAVLEFCCTAENEKNLVVPLIEQMKAADPSRPESYAAEGYMYVDLMTKSDHFSAPNTDLALAAFHRYLQMVRPSYYVAMNVRIVVDALERIKAENYQLPPH